MRITKHAEERLKERVCTTNGAAKANVRNAMNYGIFPSQTRGELKEWINRKYLLYRSANNIRIYKKRVYFFASKTLLTVYPLPEEFLENPAENFTTRAFFKLNFPQEDCYKYREEELYQRVMDIANRAAGSLGWSLRAVDVTRMIGGLRLSYVTNRYESENQNYEDLVWLFKKRFGLHIHLSRFVDDATGKELTRTQWERKQQGKPYDGFGFEKTVKNARQSRCHQAAKRTTA